ncbi:ergosterol biosynthetic protein 28 homolog [Ylistrum balloti]|uniref:ergosterol biosynthetic protein 28 homolog n=1 Tax=Ylistrum balloti TaxID=509963 RepID=UPI00290598E2|nr:ergosterol biosynthetic protein 28 homolog [Ylistrum balloti]
MIKSRSLQLISVLRTCIAVVALMTFGNALQCFVDPSFLKNRLYTNAKDDRGLTSRIVGVWTLITAILRFICAIDIYNKPIFGLTLLSFFVGLVHILAEIFHYRTTDLMPSSLIQITVSGISIIGLGFGYLFLDKSKTIQTMEDIEDSKRNTYSKYTFMKQKTS